MKIFIGLGFYGAGNVGDDFMIAGFLDAISGSALPYDSIACAIPYSLRSQQLRFPGIDWYTKESQSQQRLISACDAWVCVGDTPLQVTSGPEFFQNLDCETTLCEKEGKPVFMVGIGAEREAEIQKSGFHDIIDRTKAIAARDQATVDIIRHNFGCKGANVAAFADLANISLQRTFSQPTDAGRTYDLGWTVNTDSLDESDIRVIKSFIDGLRQTKKVFICNEVRKLNFMERVVYRQHFKPWYYPLRTANHDLFIPDYTDGSLWDLVSIYSRCKRLLTTRYHGLLIAAWAGCAVGAIARSSKVKSLADVLGVPCAEKPLKLSDLQRVYDQAVEVPRSTLDALARQATDGVRYLWEQGLNDL